MHHLPKRSSKKRQMPSSSLDLANVQNEILSLRIKGMVVVVEILSGLNRQCEQNKTSYEPLKTDSQISAQKSQIKRQLFYCDEDAGAVGEVLDDAGF